MSPIAHQLPLETTPTMAATCTICTAVALTGPPAAFVSFQRHQPKHPLHKNDHSAPSSRVPAVQFSGKCAIVAVSATTTATIATF